jgi:predicted AAA+ superfamily ATPase
MMEYLKYSIKAKIITPITVFDFKKNKEIATKTKYYFTDTDFRNSLYDFKIDTNILKENFLFTELKKSGYKINS